MVLNPILVHASLLSGPPEDKLPLAYMPLEARVAKGAGVCRKWMKLEHVSTGGGRGVMKLKTGAGDLHSTTSKHMCEILKFLLNLKVAIKIHLSCRSREHMLFDSG